MVRTGARAVELSDIDFFHDIDHLVDEEGRETVGLFI